MQDLFNALKDRRFKLATAESCTGGLIASSITASAGASKFFERGFVTYSNASKTECLGVPAELIKEFGAVSVEVAKAMAEGALIHSHADIAVSVTGIAGPDGGTEDKPVGLVYSAYAYTGHDTITRLHNFTGSRQDIQKQTTIAVIQQITQLLIKEND